MPGSPNGIRPGGPAQRRSDQQLVVPDLLLTSRTGNGEQPAVDVDGGSPGRGADGHAGGFEVSGVRCAGDASVATSPETQYGMPQMEKFGNSSARTTVTSVDGSSSRARSAAAMPRHCPQRQPGGSSESVLHRSIGGQAGTSKHVDIDERKYRRPIEARGMMDPWRRSSCPHPGRHRMLLARHDQSDDAGVRRGLGEVVEGDR